MNPCPYCKDASVHAGTMCCPRAQQVTQLREARGIGPDEPLCPMCGGWGSRSSVAGAGAGLQCTLCWGSGVASRPWPDVRATTERTMENMARLLEKLYLLEPDWVQRNDAGFTQDGVRARVLRRAAHAIRLANTGRAASCGVCSAPAGQHGTAGGYECSAGCQGMGHGMQLAGWNVAQYWARRSREEGRVK